MEELNGKSFDKPESKSFRTRTMKERVFEYLKKKPQAIIEDLYFEFPDYNSSTLRVYLMLFKNIYQTGYMRDIIKLVYEAYLTKTKVIQQFSQKEKVALKKLERWLYE